METAGAPWHGIQVVNRTDASRSSWSVVTTDGRRLAGVQLSLGVRSGSGAAMQRISWWVGQRNRLRRDHRDVHTGHGVHPLGPCARAWPLRTHGARDLWGLTQSAWALAHGQFAHIYAPSGTVASPPALPFVLVPVLGHPRHRRGPGLPDGHIRKPLALHRPGRDRSGFDSAVCHRRGRPRVELWSARVSFSLGSVLWVSPLWLGGGDTRGLIALALVVWAALSMERFGVLGAPRVALPGLASVPTGRHFGRRTRLGPAELALCGAARWRLVPTSSS